MKETGFWGLKLWKRREREGEEERERRRYKEEEDREVGGVSPFKETGVLGPQGPGVRVC